MTVADLSSDLVWAAATALTVAFVAFAIDLSRLGAKEPAAEPVTADASGDTDAPVAVAVDTPPTPVSRKAAGIGISTGWLGTILLLAAIVTRGIAAGRAPWANMYEFTLVGAFVAMAVFLGVSLRRDVRFLGAFVTGLVVLFLVVAQNSFFLDATGVQPALQSYWLVIHVGVAIIATGIFTVAFVMSAIQLLRDSRENGNGFLGHPAWRWLDTTPRPAQLEALSFRLNAVAFVLWTFTLIGGAIWAEHAWGRYWGWDPKEVWSFVVWVVYAAYLHARTTRGWSGRRAAYFVLVGYACVLFNFTGVNLIFNGKHSYSGITTQE
ncbi:c-type cytochrome biogenesis protein CcsB [Oerskovia turbata]|uniref:C-type cytochrome biogenesis protein CcsB n=1 Tax=Oerskovia turbata TaxID=1713 RepID=A0A4Q1KS40_9CELL|nr:c-type cytochrome biogenesis protein CcsB [Oerskovia turbata]RXR23597.1 c-type cytochrome biogenesis protein CcsB [Oerskovia turbata]RXR32867.1 c-type cytochrome biogenesis protein CcsB [Oerskovia turbata]TGJ95167.1 c-type cytochrome biogenesis protein CcsB [Actinotalea fermentans ATCC 43279 = JCM 9966 = DSM 3133]